MYVDYNPENERLGFNLDLGKWGNVDLNFAAGDQLKNTVQDSITNISDKVGFDFFGLLRKKRQATAPGTEPGAKPPFWTKDKVIITAVGGSLALLLLAAATKKKRKK